MKEFFKKNIAVVVGIVNVILCLVTGWLVGGDEMSLRGGVAFLAGFIAMVVEWLVFRRDEWVPTAAIVGLFVGVVLTCL